MIQKCGKPPEIGKFSYFLDDSIDNDCEIESDTCSDDAICIHKNQRYESGGAFRV